MPFERIASGQVVAARTVQPGEAIPTSAIGAAGKRGARVMSIPVESWQAAGGEIQIGDQVDVIDTGKTGPRYVLSSAAVVGRAQGTSSGIAATAKPRDLYTTVEVTEAQALELATVIEAGKFVLVRSTGAAP